MAKVVFENPDVMGVFFKKEDGEKSMIPSLSWLPAAFFFPFAVDDPLLLATCILFSNAFYEVYVVAPVSGLCTVCFLVHFNHSNSTTLEALKLSESHNLRMLEDKL